MKTAHLVAGAALLALPALCSAQAPPPAPLLSHTFETDQAGWTTFGVQARASLTSVAADVAGGKSALRIDYSVAKGEMGAAIAPIEPGALAGARCIRMTVKSGAATTLAVVLQEKEGGRYISLFHAPKDQWQKVELAPGDFAVFDDQPGDPKDPNNRLDPETVEGLGVVDFAQFLVEMGDDQMNQVLGIKPGPRVLFIDDVTVSAEAVPAGVTTGPDRKLDTFAHPQLSWVSIGIDRLSRATGAPLGVPGLKAEYRQAPQSIAGLLRMLPRGTMAGATGVALSMSSTLPIQVLLQVEEKGGGKYNTIVSLEGADAVKMVNADFASMTPADDSKDANGKLDPDQIATVVVLDFTGLMGGSEQANTLRLGNLRAVGGK